MLIEDPFDGSQRRHGTPDASAIEADASRYHAIDPQRAFVGWALNTLSTNCRAEAFRL
jgi:hypothetical protein